jgi:serine/threonine-protein kinase
MSVGGDDDTVTNAANAPVTEAGPANDELIAGRYRIVRWLGGGGMGRVYEAIDTELDERVALKVLRTGLTDDAIERFRREVKLTRRIQHRNVARMFDIGEHAGEKFLTMELVDGKPLEVQVLPWPTLKAIAEQLCAGLAAAHAAGVVHRDLKPDNVLLERGTERVVITDFGIARGGDDPSVTQVGAVVGTPRYMAPEQLAGRDVDARTDLFSLGVMLFELATGTRPWVGDSAVAIAVAQATGEPRTMDTAAAQIPAAFGSVVAACLQLDPARRPASATEVGDAIATGAEVRTSATRLQRPSKPSIPVPRVAQTAVTEPTSIAVLPTQCAPGDEYLADGMREDITDTLSTTPGLRVRPAGHVKPGDPREVGRDLGVEHVVASTLRRTPAGLRVAARLISVNDGFQIWAHKAECSESEILAVSDTLARGIATALSTRATDATRPTDARAVELYLRARVEMRRFWGAHVQAAADLLERAVEYAPTSPPILGAYAFATVQAWNMRALPELAVRARSALDRALPAGHGEAYLASAVYWFNQREPERGAQNLGIALVRAPMSAHAHEFAGRVLAEIESTTAARAEHEIAIGLDPGREQVIRADLLRLDALDGDWAAVDARVDRLVHDPDPAMVQLGSVVEARMAAWRRDHDRMAAAALRLAPRLSETANRVGDVITIAAREGRLDPALVQTYLASSVGGVDRPARQQLIGLQLIVEIALVLDQDQLALDALATTIDNGLIDVVWLDHCPLFNTVARTDAFVALRERVAARAQRVHLAFRSTQT